MHRPQIWALAGPNGAGKSTLAELHIRGRLPIVNPDVIAQALPRMADGRLDEGAAGRRAILERAGHLAAGRSFAFETTLSGHSELRAMQDAAARGFKVNLVYVGVPDAGASAFRVEVRVQAGGHDVPPNHIERRFERSMANLPAAMRAADRTYLFDNSGDRHRLILVREDGQTRIVAKRMPDWIRAALPEELRRATAADPAPTALPPGR
ncbi:hypothetical protein STAQ_33310 [Allostella sp. ATCC 35155]|nr:hypothetical protein STAQ_33310 [Stella sp. ATCC 35155]